jgi:hypothetical protein
MNTAHIMLQLTGLHAQCVIDLIVQTMKDLKLTAYGRLCSKVITVYLQVPESYAIYIFLFLFMYDCPVDVG